MLRSTFPQQSPGTTLGLAVFLMEAAFAFAQHLLEVKGRQQK
jgi:hypothetical protein